MNFRPIFLPLTLLLVCCSPAWAQASPLLGHWEGRISTPEQPLNIALDFKQGSAGLEGTIDIPSQMLVGHPLKDLRVDGDMATFVISEVPGNPTFQGRIHQEGKAPTLVGDFSQNGMSFAFSVTRGKKTPRTSGEPQPPFPYSSKEVTLQGATGRLAGTLTMPQGKAKAAVILITGSGPQDRDETLAGHKPFLVLSDALTRAGYAVLRTDDPGVGGSTGELSQANYQDLVKNIRAQLDFLAQDSQTKNLSAVLIGHSEGGYLAPLVAQQDDRVKAVVMLAGPSVSGAEVLLTQNREILSKMGMPEPAVKQQVAFIKRLTQAAQDNDLDEARRLIAEQVKKQLANLPAAQQRDGALQRQMLEQQIALYASPNFRAFVTYDPAAALKALEVPILALYGGKDTQVNAQASAKAFKTLTQDNADAKLKVFAPLNHLMQRAQKGTPDEYASIAETMSPDVTKAVSAWLNAIF